jgi:phosphohistidine phosphatase
MAMLELYLVRHGVAAERGADWPDDSKRPLTAHGLAKLRKEAAGLASVGVVFDVIVTSPLLRTRQTADAFADVFKTRPAIVLSDALAPAGTRASVLAEIAKHARKARIALVGHEPNLGELAAALVGAKQPFEFKKGGVCRIDFDVLPPKGLGTLVWFLPPKVLRKLAH